MRKLLLKDDLDHVLKYAKDAFESLRNARIFITGGTGFFGIWLLESLIHANQHFNLNIKITVLTRRAEQASAQFPHIVKEKYIRFQQGDIRNFEFSKEKFSHIIHAATEASAKLNKENPIEMFDVITQGSKHLFDFARQCEAKNILFVSSGAVYGRQPPELSHIPETFLGSLDILNPDNAYGMGKKSAEHLAILYHAQYRLNIKIARCFAFVGPHLPLDAHFAIGNFIRDALQHKKIILTGDGASYRSYQYAADLMVWLFRILCFGKNVYPYNVGSDAAISISELAELITQFSSEKNVVIAKKPNPNTLPERYVPSIDRAQCELQLENYIDLRESIRRTLQWYQE